MGLGLIVPEMAAHLRPKSGDVVLQCGHIHEIGSGIEAPNWCMFDPSMHVYAPNGEYIEARWLVCCDACYEEADGDADLVEIGGHGRIGHVEPIPQA